MKKCKFCREHALLREETDSSRFFCSKPCQWLHYTLTGSVITQDTIRDVWAKMIRDVPVERVATILKTDQLMQKLCMKPEFFRLYYQRNKDQVVQRTISLIRSYDPEALWWIYLILDDNPEFQRTYVILYAARTRNQELLDRFQLTPHEVKMVERERQE